MFLEVGLEPRNHCIGGSFVWHPGQRRPADFFQCLQDIVDRLGLSPDKGDAVMMAWTSGAKLSTHGRDWVEMGMGRGRRPPPKVNLGHRAARR